MQRCSIVVAVAALVLMGAPAVAAAQTTGGIAGKVIDQTGGVLPGATVTLTVSKGPPAVQVPDLSNQPADAARQALAQLGLQATVIGGGTVRIQNPGAGTQVPPGTNVVLWCF